ncbi:glycosyltransferase [Rhodobacterales bacterium LSUCC0387]|nr:glycosyltransferase [Rhodobacterales bacterium LSUCC0387]
MSENREPLVSICIPTYNAGATLAETLTSIINQSYKHLEILIVDNASTDNTVEVANRFSDPRIKIHQNTENIGGEENFNRCISLAKGLYTAIYHADDLYTVEMVERQVNFLDSNPEAGGVFTEAAVMDERGKIVGAIHFPNDLRIHGARNLSFFEVFRALLRHSNFLVCPSAMVRTSIYKNCIKRWRGEMFGSSADLDVWLRIARQTNLGILPEALMNYRVSDRQFSAKVRQKTDRADFFRVIDHYLQKFDIREALTQADLNNYKKLVQRDTVMRSVNLFLLNDFTRSKLLLKELDIADILREILSDKRSFAVFILWIFLNFSNNPGLRKIGQVLLMHAKRIFRK